MATFIRMATKVILVSGFCMLLVAQTVLSQSKPVTLEELARRSEVVAVGQVKELTSEWDETGARIRTKVLLSVEEFVKGGEAGNTLTLYVPGGEIGTVGEVYSHMPTFKKEEQVIVFAQRDNQNRYRVSAGQQGKFTIQRDQRSGQAVVPGHATLEIFTSEVRRTVRLQK